ncbi:MAG: DUF4062 domain-containing protein [Candidatus Sulfotelmatobacter sp.]
MQKRKLQIFLSSTYEDLIDHRLAAMEAILAAGHIPAAMEQFAPGDETAWEKIKAWIDESDAFILILGGRYGSIDPASGKSYVQCEYEYVMEKKKPFFALVVSKEHHEQRVRDLGLKVDERENPEKYKKFNDVVTQKLCRFWSDKKDIQAAIFQKLPEWAQRAELIGWVRGDEVTGPEVMNELARLSHENRELRALSAAADTFDGLSFEELLETLAERQVADEDLRYLREYRGIALGEDQSHNLLTVFETIFEQLAAGLLDPDMGAFVPLMALGLAEKDALKGRVTATEGGRRFRNRLLAQRRSLGARQELQKS